MNSREYLHGEAYNLMNYSTGTGREIVIWNSRDGVSPFCAIIDDVEYQHVRWQDDVKQRDHMPEVGSYIFIDCDHATWEAQEKAKIEAWWDDGEYPMNRMFATKEEALTKLMEAFELGQPMTVKVTPEIKEHFKARLFPNRYNNPVQFT